MKSFPTSDYSPLGYLDNRSHSWVLRPSGVVSLRELFALAWHWPWQVAPRYIAEMRLFFKVGEQHLAPSAHAWPAGFDLRCPYHSKNVVVLELVTPAGCVVVEGFIGGRDLLCWRGRLHAWDPGVDAHLLAVARLWSPRRAVGPWQGGVVGVWDPAEAVIILRHYAEGLVLRLSSLPTAVGGAIGPGLAEVVALLRAGGSSDPVHRHSRSWRQGWGGITLPLQGAGEFWVRLSRGGSHEAASRAGSVSPRAMRAVASDLMSEDRRFWTAAPRLQGDWSETWKRGWVYDWETLRMCVRDPIGVFRSPWDAMQIQMPRVVVAETMLDMLMMSYADPELARAVVLGTFRDARSPQVPCSREDGSVNMVAVDGSECGTSPCWCFPFHCLLSVYLRAGSRRWLRQLLPYLERYLLWWLIHRVDAGGFAVYKCSWESGQDCSARFGVRQPTGGELVEHVRPVDLQAGMAYAARVLSFLASEVGRSGRPWEKVAAHFERRTRDLWHRGRFRDQDGRTERPVMSDDYADLTFLAPLMCMDAGLGESRSMAQELEYFAEHPEGWLEWPSFFFQFCECAWAAHKEDLLAEVVADTAERIYSHWDRRKAVKGLPLPGVAAENWLPAGMEGYGWGATLPVTIIRCLLGIRAKWERRVTVELRPNLPPALMVPGREYKISPLRFRDVSFGLTYEVTSPRELRAVLDRLDNVEDPWIAHGPRDTPVMEARWGPSRPLVLSLAPRESWALYRR
jgi:hypothetical protein